MQLAVEPSREATAPRWGAAVGLAVLWHLLVGLALELGNPLAPRESAQITPAPVQLTFRSAPTEPVTESAAERARDTARPNNFTELPPDRADARPDRADALSNVDSRARDRVEGDERTDLPNMNGIADAPAVAMEPSPAVVEGPGSGVPGQPTQEDGPAIDPANSDLDRDLRAAPDADARDDTGEVAREGEVSRREQTGVQVTDGGGRPATQTGDPFAIEDQQGNAAPATEPRYLIGNGRDDIFQEEMANSSGNVPLFGEVSLNTVAWEYAPWLQRLRREFYRNWLPPYAYFLGIIKGYQVVFLEVAPDGTLLRLDVQEQEGHESLRESTEGNFRSLAPYHPLPKDFPEPTLQITIKVVYPGAR